jgi:glucose-1-phosphate cytidylyltransferase
MKTVILAGGLGTRLSEETVVKPKPMVEVGGRPILWHIMKIYGAQGFHEFLVALGYKGEIIKDYFLNYSARRRDLTIELRRGTIEPHANAVEDWRVHLIDTGVATQSGGRLRRLRSILDNETFLMTYGDGVANVDLKALVNFHRKSGALATLTAVRPPARFGGLTLDGDRVSEFAEKPQIGEGWINGGFFVLEPGVLDFIDRDETIFEREPLERLATLGKLAAFRHTGFWRGMDTLRDVNLLNHLWETGAADWKVWT